MVGASDSPRSRGGADISGVRLPCSSSSGSGGSSSRISISSVKSGAGGNADMGVCRGGQAQTGQGQGKAKDSQHRRGTFSGFISTRVEAIVVNQVKRQVDLSTLRRYHRSLTTWKMKKQTPMHKPRDRHTCALARYSMYTV